MSVNNDYISDEDGSFSDWIELYNHGDEPVNLLGYGLSDDYENPFRWIIPDIEIGANDYLTIWASGKNKTNTEKLEINGIMRHFFPNTSGSSVNDLINAPTFPDNPHSREVIISHFEAPSNIADNYGQHMFTWITPPQTGEYVFWISSDDHGQLFISQDSDPENASLIAEVPGWSNVREWDKYPEQQSEPVILEKGKRYYLSALMKEEYGGDNLSVRWKLPNGNMNEPISAEYCMLTLENSLHTNFSISGEGEKIILTAPGGEMVDSMPSTPMLPNVSFGRKAGDYKEWYYFENPTPGRINDTPHYSAILEKPEISMQKAHYNSTSKQITITAAQGEIYYTTNGSMPSPSNGTRYTSPFVINNSSLVRAKATSPDKIDSQVAAASFIKSSTYSHNFESEIPIMIIQHFNETISDNNEIIAYMTLIDDDVNEISNINSSDFLQSRIKINYRGSSSLTFPKKGYGFHLIDEAGYNRKESLLGMPEEHNWILHGPYSDKTLMRNEVSYKMSEETGHYAPRTRFVELFVHSGNQSLSKPQNHGIYLLVERIKIADGRLDLNGVEPHNNDEPYISGGYIIKKDRLNHGENGFRSQRGSHFAFVRPNEQNITPKQSNYLVQYIDSLENALRNIPYESEKKSYTKFIDTQSFIDYHIVTEACKEIDGFRLSTFLHKDRGGKIKMGPVWDFNLSLGNADYMEGWKPTGWYYPLISTYDYLYGWYNFMFSDKEFEHAYKTRYRVLRQGALSTQHLTDKIYQNTNLLSEAQERDEEKWNTIGQKLWPNWYVGNTWHDEINFMADWLEKRLNWMDTQLGQGFTLMHYWNFNTNTHYKEAFYTSGNTELTIEPGKQSEITYDESSIFHGGNSRMFHHSPSHLRINNPIGTQLTIQLSSNGFTNTAFSFEAVRSSNGANTLYIEYSADGENYLPFDTVHLTTVPVFYTRGLSSLENAENNPNFAIRITIDNEELRLGGSAGNVRFDNFTLDGDALPGTNLPPVQLSELPEVFEMTEGNTLSIDLNDYFTDPENDEITYSIVHNNTSTLGSSIYQSELVFDAYNRGDTDFSLSITDGINPAFKISGRVLVYPRPAELSLNDYRFNSWPMQEREGNFPEHMIFLQSNRSDPGISTPLSYAYHIPHDDYAESDVANIGFPYRNNSRTRINGLGPNGIMFVNTGRNRDLGSAVVSTNTLACDMVHLNWSASTMQANSREYAIRPQYRIGLNSPWKNFYHLDGHIIEYKRSNYVMSKEHFTEIPLPEEAMNQELVQLAFRYYYTGRRNSFESGARDYLALHEIHLKKKDSLNTGNEPNETALKYFYNREQETLHLNRNISGNIFNILGQKITAFENKQAIQLYNIQPGVYLCAPNNEKGFRFVVH